MTPWRSIVGMRRSSASIALLGALALALVIAADSLVGITASAQSDTGGDANTQDQLLQLVAPIALYPDALVAQILAGSTYPTQIVDAARFLRDNSNLTGGALVNAVNQQTWDPSVQALTQFPSVLNDMSQNLSWTSALGDAYYNDQQNVLAAIQELRQRALQAGTLKTTSQQTVTTDSSTQTIIIAPAQPTVVYVPTYNPSIGVRRPGGDLSRL